MLSMAGPSAAPCSSAPKLMANSGLRRSCPSTAMNCSRNSAVRVLRTSRLGALLAFFGFDLQRQHAGKRLHGRLDRAAAQLRGVGVRAQIVPKKAPIGTEHGTKCSFRTCTSGGCGGRGRAGLRVALSITTDTIASHGFRDKKGWWSGPVRLTPRPNSSWSSTAQARSGVLRHAGDRGKPQAGHVADDFEHGRHRADAADGGDVGGFLPPCSGLDLAAMASCLGSYREVLTTLR